MSPLHTKEMLIMSYSQEEKELINKFQKTFEVRANSMASQLFEINYDTGTTSYEETMVYGDTAELEILMGGEVVKVFNQPVDDSDTVVNFAKKWKEAGYPLPSDNQNLFDNEVISNV